MSLHAIGGARIVDGPLRSTEADGVNGCFIFASCEPGWKLECIISDGSTLEDEGLAGLPRWEHVSVKARREHHTRTPTWKEMEQVKRTFWEAGDVVMQLHVAESDHINCHPHVLHLWKPLDAAIPLPPKEYV